jgi:hypothetical protein
MTMRTRSGCLTKAAEMLARADKADSSDTRATFVQLARSWILLACLESDEGTQDWTDWSTSARRARFWDQGIPAVAAFSARFDRFALPLLFERGHGVVTEIPPLECVPRPANRN